jgi:hypothetical protein
MIMIYLKILSDVLPTYRALAVLFAMHVIPLIAANAVFLDLICLFLILNTIETFALFVARRVRMRARH